ncbi:DUF4397 domain-containing protein [Chitinophaga ginsengisegetis]|uniref:hypothetical protein n=1 Tax=Chitinophaga ginsengisegetis TaxID=393003 RepID=UPI003435E36A
MKQFLHYTILIVILLTGATSCKKETPADDFIVFGQLKINNATSYSALRFRLEGYPKQMQTTGFMKLEPGANHLQIWGLTEDPADKPVFLFDSLLRVEASQTHEFTLFQPDEVTAPIALVNTQASESKPPAGFMKVKAANFATHCFPGEVDLQLLMMDFSLGDIANVATIPQLKAAFDSYGLYRTLDATNTDGYTIFYILDPVTHERLHTDFIFGIDLMNYTTGKLYEVVTLFIYEKQNSAGLFTGTDGNKYDVAVKALYLD